MSNEEKMNENQEKVEKVEKKCDCGPDCDCGCQEGKECTCEDREEECCCRHHHHGPHGPHHGPHGPHHGPHDHGCCKCGCVKLLVLLLVFFAGIGVNEFWNNTCFGRCPSRGPRPMPMAPMVRGSHSNVPDYSDAAGNTIIIVNSGEDAATGCNCNMKNNAQNGGCQFAKKHAKRNKNRMNNQPKIVHPIMPLPNEAAK